MKQINGDDSKLNGTETTDTETQNTAPHRACVIVSLEFRKTFFFTDTEALNGHDTDNSLMCVCEWALT